LPLTFLPTPIGNLEDITFRTVKAIQNCEIVFCEDTRVAKKLFDLLTTRYDIDISKKTFYPLHSHNEERILDNIDISIFDKNCVYMSDAGMPCISDPGALLAAYAQKNSIEYDVLPGPSAVTTVYAASGFLDSKFLFYGFLPHKTTARMDELKKLTASECPVIFYEAPHRILQFCEELVEIDENADIFASKELTKLHQKYFRTNPKELLAKLKSSSIKGEWAVVVKFSKQNGSFLSLGIDEIMELELPKKQAARLISKITGENAKNIYEKLITQNS